MVFVIFSFFFFEISLSDGRKDVLDTLAHLLPVILAGGPARQPLRVRYLNAIAKQFASMQKRENRQSLVECMRALAPFIPSLEPVVSYSI